MMQQLIRRFAQSIAGVVIVTSSLPHGHVQAKPTPITTTAVAERLSGRLAYPLEGDRQIFMTTCRVTKAGESPDQIYLYQEQARDDQLDQPYRQRFLELSATHPDKVASISYRPVNESAWINFCSRDSSDRRFSDQDVLLAHCTLTLKQKGRKFVGNTPPEGCASNYRGAAFVHNRVILTRKGMKTFDQGFDADGKRVWGSDGTPYTFKKILPE